MSESILYKFLSAKINNIQARRERKKKKAGCEEVVKKRELKRTVAHGSDLGHVPFRKVRVERLLGVK
tara:strand:+ start:306 stop:506 length:201 start_codon:yes stop_codon:yes gene_type:complete